MKDFAVIFSPIAIDDAKQAVDYYEEKQAGLGNDLLASYRVHLIVSNEILTNIRRCHYESGSNFTTVTI